MNYKQNEKINQVKESTLVVGIDIGSTTQYARAFDWRGIELGKVFTFSNSREGFEAFKAWMQHLQDKYRKSDVIVGIEPTGHYWFDLGAYLEDEGILLVMVNPYAVKQTKELDDNSQSKNDRKDPKVIAKLVTEGRYSAPYTPDPLQLTHLLWRLHEFFQFLVGNAIVQQPFLQGIGDQADFFMVPHHTGFTTVISYIVLHFIFV